jgi:GNAT superfamily N-acetyltransferase
VNVTFELDPHLDETLVDQLESIWEAVGNAGGSVGTPMPTTRADVKVLSDKAFREVSEGHDHILVAFQDGRPVGFGFLSHNHPGEIFKHWAIVKRLQVLPALQGQGIGSALLKELTRAAKEQLGLEQLQLTVREGTGTEAFYERFGYEVVGRVPGAIRVAPGDDRDMIYMMARL